MSNEKKYAGAALSKEHIVTGMERNNIAKETFDNISKLNVNRGEIKGYIFENLHAKDLNYELSKKGLKATVLDNNGSVDIIVSDIKTGKVVEQIQAKCGYENKAVGAFKRYTEEGQTLVINGDANKFSKNLDNKGIAYQKSNVTNAEVSEIANNMKKEGKYLKTSNAKVTTSVYKTKEILKNCHTSGINAAKSGACFGAGLSIGSNMVDVICGEKEIGEATVNIAKDTVIAGATGYVAGAAGAAIASTAVGGAAIAGVSAAGAAVASTAVGGAVIAGATAAGATAAAAGAAVTGAVAAGATAAGAAVASTAVGGAVVAGATAAGAAVASTAVGGAVVAGVAAAGAVAVAAAPVVAVGAAVGAVFSIGKKIFGR